jgi:hypothetical protein
MKTLFTFIISALISFNLAAQNKECDNVNLASAAEIKSAEHCVLMWADTVLQKPLHSMVGSLRPARDAIFEWMKKTPDYHFAIDTQIVNMCKDDNEYLLTVYTASMAKAALTSKGNTGKQTLSLLANYIRNPVNGVAKTTQVEEFLKAYDAGKMDKYLRD